MVIFYLYIVDKESCHYVQESDANYSYQDGDIVFVKKYQYKNCSEGKNHLFVLINVDDKSTKNCGFLISSNTKKSLYQYNVIINRSGLNKLKKQSIVKCDDLIDLKGADIKRKIGTVNKEQLRLFKILYKKYLLNM